MKQVQALLFFSIVVAPCASLRADYIAIPAATQHDLVINSVTTAGTSDTGLVEPEGSDGSTRDEDYLVSAGGTSNMGGNPIMQSQADVDSLNYFNNAGPVAGGTGLLIDLGSSYLLQALQLYGYNITNGGTDFHGRSLGSFTIWTATSPLAVTTAGGSLLVSDIALFTQWGGTLSMDPVSASSTPGQTYLFSGASQPSDVTGTTTTVTALPVDARYIFLRDMLPQTVTDVVGLGEIRIYGIPEPSAFFLSLLGLPILVWMTRARRAAR